MTSWTMARIIDSPTLVGQRFGSAKASGPSLLITVNLHRSLKEGNYSLVQTKSKFLKIVSDIIIRLYLISMMTSWTMARIVDGPTLVVQALYDSNVLLAQRSTTPRLMLDDMINDDFMNDGSNIRRSNPCESRASLLQCLVSWKVNIS